MYFFCTFLVFGINNNRILHKETFKGKWHLKKEIKLTIQRKKCTLIFWILGINNTSSLHFVLGDSLIYECFKVQFTKYVCWHQTTKWRNYRRIVAMADIQWLTIQGPFLGYDWHWILIRWVSVAEFHNPTLGIGKVFGQESTVVKWNYQILSLHLVTACQKVPILDFQTEFSMSKIIQIFIKNHWRISI